MEYAPKGFTGNVGSSLNAPTAIADESASRIRDGISGSEQLLSELQESICRFERRLDTVLTPVPPSTSAQTNPKPSPIGSHVTGRMEILNEGLSHCISRLHELTRRVEV